MTESAASVAPAAFVRPRRNPARPCQGGRPRRIPADVTVLPGTWRHA
jgi:hypothetical protein